MGKVYKKEYEIHFYEVNDKLKATMETILNFIEDIGTEQSEKLGCGMEYLLERNMAWVFYQYDVLVNRYPSYGERIKVVTEPSAINKFYATRSYKMYDENDEIIVDATAIFFLINIEKRRTMRVPIEQYDFYGLNSEDKLDFKIERLEKLNEAKYSNEFKVRHSDIDINKHVNNTKYVQWAIESVPFEIFNSYEVERLKVNFEKECTYGGAVRVLTEVRSEEDITTIHKIESIEEEKSLTNLIINWRKTQ